MDIAFDIIIDDVTRALTEDLGSGDVSTALLPDGVVNATILSREPMVVAGIPWVNRVFQQVDPGIAIQWWVDDGFLLPQGQRLCELRGSARTLLTAERTALNFLQTLSGVATKTKRYVDTIAHTQTKLLDTRKTIPGLRSAEKYAVRCGGGHNHRMGLYDAYLLKENHIRALGSVTNAVQFARDRQDGLCVEVEVETLDEFQEAMAVKPDRILLDNFSHAMIQSAVALNQPKICDLEVSGGISLDNIAEIAATGVDWISVGDLTKSVQAIDLSLLVEV